MPGHYWFRKWLGVRSAPSHYLEQYRSSETIGLRPKDILLLNEPKQAFYQVQYIKTNKNTNTTQSVCEPLSEPIMVRCVLKVPKLKHDTFGKRAFAVCGPLSWNLGMRWNWSIQANPKNSSFRLVKFVNESTLATWLEASLWSVL